MNPLSVEVGDVANELTTGRLREVPAASGLATYPASGVPIDPGWDSEESFAGHGRPVVVVALAEAGICRMAAS